MTNKPPIDITALLEQGAWDTQMYGLKAKREPFAPGLNAYKLVWVFFLASLAGVVLETGLKLFATGALVRTSGMVVGPFNQVYGLGAVLFLLVLYPLRWQNGALIFAAGTALGLLFEFCTSWLQEHLFRSTSWDYSDLPFNLGGRTNLLYGLGWGLLAFLFVRHIWPCISRMVGAFPPRVGRVVTIALAVLLCLDMGLSAAAVTRWQQRDLGVQSQSLAARWLDTYYPDWVMREKYPGLTFAE